MCKFVYFSITKQTDTELNLIGNHVFVERFLFDELKMMWMYYFFKVGSFVDVMLFCCADLENKLDHIDCSWRLFVSFFFFLA